MVVTARRELPDGRSLASGKFGFLGGPTGNVSIEIGPAAEGHQLRFTLSSGSRLALRPQSDGTLGGEFHLPNGGQWNLSMEKTVSPLPAPEAGAAASPKIGSEVGAVFTNYTFIFPSGDRKRHADYRGKPTVVVYWETWCPSCLRYMPTLMSLHADLGGAVNILPLTISGPAAAAQRWLDQLNIPFQTARAVGSPSFHGIPKTYVLDANGKVLAQGHRLSEDELRRLVSGK